MTGGGDKAINVVGSFRDPSIRHNSEMRTYTNKFPKTTKGLGPRNMLNVRSGSIQLESEDAGGANFNPNKKFAMKQGAYNIMD